jgi:hypothetical protein
VDGALGGVLVRGSGAVRVLGAPGGRIASLRLTVPAESVRRGNPPSLVHVRATINFGTRCGKQTLAETTPATPYCTMDGHGPYTNACEWVVGSKSPGGCARGA